MPHNRRVQNVYERLFRAWQRSRIAVGYDPIDGGYYVFDLTLARCQTIAAGVRAEWEDHERDPDVDVWFKGVVRG